MGLLLPFCRSHQHSDDMNGQSRTPAPTNEKRNDGQSRTPAPTSGKRYD